ncbi:MAG TPA: hypothetical protein VEB43_05880 [Anaeromyxobacter sp.]|nr:hypothetical protein [Anaeromyxobacter sp.]
MISSLGQSRRRHSEETMPSSAGGASLRSSSAKYRILNADPRFLEVPPDP